MISEADLKKFSKIMRPEYVAAILGGLDHLRAAGILENEHRLAHFMGQFGAETDGGRIIRESLYYTTANRLRTVWPARFRNKSDAELRPLLKNERALGDAVYMGRMGNSAPGDGYAYRGGGFIQTTGKSAVAEYAGKLNIAPSPQLLDDCAVTLRFACQEWQESGCNQWADENDVLKVSKAINTGSATSKVQPVGMSDRRAWFAKAWGVWGGKGKPDTEPAPPPSNTKVAGVGTGAGLGTGIAIEAVKTLAAPQQDNQPTTAPSPPPVAASPIPVPPAVVTDAVNNVGVWKSTGVTVKEFALFAKAEPVVVGGIVFVMIALLFGPRLLKRLGRL